MNVLWEYLLIDKNSFFLLDQHKESDVTPVKRILIKSFSTHFSSQLVSEDLTPGAWGGTQVHHAADTSEDVELLIDLQQFEGRASPPALLLG